MSNNIPIGAIKQSFSERSGLNEKNDCTVRALAAAMEIEYLEAYGILLGAGRKARKGIHVDKLYSSLFSTTISEPHMTVERFIKTTIIWGNWIVQVRGHVFAVNGGTIHDINPTASLNCHVQKAWRVK